MKPIWQRRLKRTGKQRSEWWFRCEQGCDLPRSVGLPQRTSLSATQRYATGCNRRRSRGSQALIAQQEQQALNAGKRGGQVLFTFEADS
jgi:hypothetical protein